MDIKISLDFPSYEEDISDVIKREILDQVIQQVRISTKPLRKAVAEQLARDQEALIKRTLTQVKKELQL